MKKWMTMFLLTIFVTSTTFADTASERDKTKKGAVIGGTLGAVVGAVIGNNGKHHSSTRGATVGVLAGAAAGAIVGSMMDKQERELRQINGVDVQRTSDNELKVTVKNDVLFDTGSSSLRGTSRAALRDMADVFQRYGDTRISIEGHTDSVGSASYNETLSESRADRVAGYLENLGVRSSRLRTIGYGESRPRASNNSASGRQLNRRVEIHVRANA
jgi:outer membrane protein OmpA-like peptidoglycan-associated protein